VAAVEALMSKGGFFIFVGVVPGALWLVAIFDWVRTLVRPNQPPIGHYVQEFILGHPWLGAVLAAVYAAMIAHFFLHIDHG
jgi:hypothetical protein